MGFSMDAAAWAGEFNEGRGGGYKGGRPAKKRSRLSKRPPLLPVAHRPAASRNEPWWGQQVQAGWLRSEFRQRQNG